MQAVWRAVVVGDAFGPGSPPGFLTAVGASLAIAIPLVAVLSMGPGRLADGATEAGPRH